MSTNADIGMTHVGDLLQVILCAFPQDPDGYVLTPILVFPHVSESAVIQRVSNQTIAEFDLQ